MPPVGGDRWPSSRMASPPCPLTEGRWPCPVRCLGLLLVFSITPHEVPGRSLEFSKALQSPFSQEEMPGTLAKRTLGLRNVRSGFSKIRAAESMARSTGLSCDLQASLWAVGQACPLPQPDPLPRWQEDQGRKLSNPNS